LRSVNEKGMPESDRTEPAPQGGDKAGFAQRWVELKGAPHACPAGDSAPPVNASLFRPCTRPWMALRDLAWSLGLLQRAAGPGPGFSRASSASPVLRPGSGLVLGGLQALLWGAPPLAALREPAWSLVLALGLLAQRRPSCRWGDGHRPMVLAAGERSL